MKAQLIAVAVTLINLVTMTLVLTQLRPAHAQQAAPVLRAQGLEIVDSQGRIRASITIQPRVMVDGKKYSETVLLRLIAPNGKPMAKLGGTESGAGLTLIDGSDEGLLLRGDNEGSYIKITENGKEKIIRSGSE